MNDYLWLFILLLIALLLKSKYIKGKTGEAIVNFTNKIRLDETIYKSVNNITIKLKDGTTTQIDHVIVSKFGIFVIETKNMKGWIFGSEHQSKWTQNIFGKKHQFQNPLHQNYKHTKSIEELLGFKKHIFSVIVFVGECEFKTKMPKNVFMGGGYINYIKSFNKTLFTASEVENIIYTLKNGSLKKGIRTDWEHVNSLKNRHSNHNKMVCKRCGSNMVERVNKKRNTKFLGCSSYPKCRYTQEMKVMQ